MKQFKRQEIGKPQILKLRVTPQSCNNRYKHSLNISQTPKSSFNLQDKHHKNRYSTILTQQTQQSDDFLNKQFNLLTENIKKLQNQYFKSIDLEDNTSSKWIVQLPQKPQKVSNSKTLEETQSNPKIIEFHNQLGLHKRAQQFIETINKEKSRLQGKLFVLKHQQQQKKMYQQKIEEYERNMIKEHQKEQRRAKAIEHLKIFKKKAALRDKQQKLRISRLKSLDASISISRINHKRQVKRKQDVKQTNSVIINSGIKGQAKHFVAALRLKNDIYLQSQDDRNVEKARKMLLQLDQMINRERELIKSQL